jgi:hypothetical protein
MYYLRSRPAADAIKFTLDVEALLKESKTNDENNPIKNRSDLVNKENNGEEAGPPLKKVKTESAKRTVCGEDICYSCGS